MPKKNSLADEIGSFTHKCKPRAPWHELVKLKDADFHAEMVEVIRRWNAKEFVFSLPSKTALALFLKDQMKQKLDMDFALTTIRSTVSDIMEQSNESHGRRSKSPKQK